MKRKVFIIFAIVGQIFLLGALSLCSEPIYGRGGSSSVLSPRVTINSEYFLTRFNELSEKNTTEEANFQVIAGAREDQVRSITAEFLNDIFRQILRPGMKVRFKTSFTRRIGSEFQAWPPMREEKIISEGEIIEAEGVLKVQIDDKEGLDNIDGKIVPLKIKDIIFVYDADPLIREEADGTQRVVLYRVWFDVKDSNHFVQALLRNGIYSNGLSQALEESGGDMQEAWFYRMNLYEALVETWEGISPDIPLIPFSTAPTIAIAAVRRSKNFVIVEIEVPQHQLLQANDRENSKLKSRSLSKDSPEKNDPLFYVPQGEQQNHENEYTSLFAHLPSSYVVRVFTPTTIWEKQDIANSINMGQNSVVRSSDDATKDRRELLESGQSVLKQNDLNSQWRSLEQAI